MTQIIRLLLSMVPQQRGYNIREPSTEYTAGSDDSPFADILENVPFAGERET